jgi:hypothetical protein
MRRSTRVSATTLAVAVFAAGCTDGSAPFTPGVPDQPSIHAQVEAPDQLALAAQIPGFGGLFLDQGMPTVYLQSPDARGAAERALAGFMRARGQDRSELRVLPARFHYQQLDTWFREIMPIHTVEGVVFSDLDEAANILTVGVEHGSARLSAEALLAGLDVPREAIRFVEAEPIRPLVTLRDMWRPVSGGLQLHFGMYVCTLGFNALHAGGNSFITNSHCTDKQGQMTSTAYNQPNRNLANSYVGVEVDDPAYFKGGVCPRGKNCRYSDSSRGLYEAGVTFDLGVILRTASRHPTEGTLDIDLANPTFLISGKQNNVLVGQEVNKMGRTTGWTYGNVSNTCVNTSVQGSNIMQLCQTWASMGSQGGDSGSSVFSWSGGGTVQLNGILWGGNSTSIVYSPINNIEQELGALTVN